MISPVPDAGLTFREAVQVRFSASLRAPASLLSIHILPMYPLPVGIQVNDPLLLRARRPHPAQNAGPESPPRRRGQEAGGTVAQNIPGERRRVVRMRPAPPRSFEHPRGAFPVLPDA